MVENVTAVLEALEQAETSTGKKYHKLVVDGDVVSAWSKGLVAGLEVGKTYQFPVVYGEFNKLVGKPKPAAVQQTIAVPVTFSGPAVAREESNPALDPYPLELRQLAYRKVVAMERIAAALHVISRHSMTMGGSVQGSPEDMALREAWASWKPSKDEDADNAELVV